MTDPVSVFISRKTGRLYVRQGFEPLFDMAVTIRDPDARLGTHIYTAIAANEDRTALRWTAMTLPERTASEPEPRRHGKKRMKHDEQEPVVHVPDSVRIAAASALDRVDIPQGAIDRISDLLSPGASLIISDYPLSSETGKYTDFIVETK